MFSGLTNQVSSWMGSSGKKEGESPKSEEDKLQSPITDADIGIDGEGKVSSPTKASKLEMLSNVKSQMTGWLGSGIPGLRKTDHTAEGTENAADGKVEAEASVVEKPAKGSPDDGKEDDNSSATGGADSDAPVSEPGTPGEDKEGAAGFAGAGAVSTKALQGAKSIGSFLYSAVNKAGKTVSDASAKIKKTVEENSLLGEFNKEQDAFIKEKQGKGSDAAVPPWVGCPNEEALKEEFLTLSTDRRNFVRSPPAGVEFDFDYEVTYPVALATLAEDPNLEKMRFELVPKVINEENFWRNYFYRVSLIRQANELSSMAQEGGRGSGPSSRINSVEGEAAAKPQHEAISVGPGGADADSPQHEFVSDTFRASTTDIEEVREGMRRLGIDPSKREEDEWEKELEAELQDYEVVADSTNATTTQDPNWENEIQDMLDDEDVTDLK